MSHDAVVQLKGRVYKLSAETVIADLGNQSTRI